MSQSNSHGGSSHSSHSTHTATSEAGHELKHAAATEHKAVRAARKVDSKVYEAEVLASGNPKRIERYFVRKFAYRMFGRFMGKTLNKI